MEEEAAQDLGVVKHLRGREGEGRPAGGWGMRALINDRGEPGTRPGNLQDFPPRSYSEAARGGTRYRRGKRSAKV